VSRPRSQTASSAPAAPEGVAVASSALSLRLRVRWTPPPPPEGFCCEVRVRFTDSTAPRVSRSSRAAGAARGLRSSQVRAEFSALSTLRRAPRFHACARRIPVSLSPPWVRVASAEASALRPRAARRRRSVGPRGVSRVGCFLGRWSLLAVPSLEGAACRRVPHRVSALGLPPASLPHSPFPACGFKRWRAASADFKALLRRRIRCSRHRGRRSWARYFHGLLRLQPTSPTQPEG